MDLSGKAQRVLGALIEKAMATPDGYPLSANALRGACNQKTARDPVVNYLDTDVKEGIAELKEHGLILTKFQHGSRVPKFAHLADEKLDLRDAHLAALGVLLLRGPQTVGEVNGRTNRMHEFTSLGEVEQVLEGLTDHKFHGALVERLPREPGQKEERWRHLLGPVQAGGMAPAAPSPDAALFEELKAQIAELQARNAALEAEVLELQGQIEQLTAP